MVERKGKVKNILRNKLFWFSTAVIATIIIILFGVNIWLYINFILGHDIILKSSIDKTYLSLTRGEIGNVEVTNEVIANPFCSAVCESKFVDISNDRLINHTLNFIIAPPMASKAKYSFSVDKIGYGQNYYRYEISCRSKASALCRTKGSNTTRKILITVDYQPNAEDKVFLASLKALLERKVSLLFTSEGYLNSFRLVIANLSEQLSIPDLENKMAAFEQTFSHLQNISDEMKKSWGEQQFYYLNESLKLADPYFSNLTLALTDINSRMTSAVSEYNRMLDNLTLIRNALVNLTVLNITNSTVNEAIENVTLSFNSQLVSFKSSKRIMRKTEIIYNMSREIGLVSAVALAAVAAGEYSNTSNFIFTSIDEINLSYLSPPTAVSEVPFTLDEPHPICCVFGNCMKCCNESCSSEKDYYPLVFVHGHSFNKDLTVEFTLEGFNSFESKLESEGYLEAGAVSVYTEKEDIPEWSKIPMPLMLKLSYYYDILKQPENYVLVVRKSERIDSYAIRLKEIIDTVTYKTGRNKVIIVAHSMGALVSRRYIQIFGTGKVDRLILLGAPNKGIEGSVAVLCPVLGEQPECDDMKTDSIFMNKLNMGRQPAIPVYNFVAEGCDMQGEAGDGIILKRNALLDGDNVQNIIVSGNCSGVDFFHVNMLDADRNPHVFQKVKEVLA